MNRTVQRAILGAYRLVFAHGLLRFAWGRRLFFALYHSYKRLFEARRVGGLRPYVKEGSCVIDVGANVGFFTPLFARWSGPRGRVVAIEPETTNHTELVRRLAAAGWADRVRAPRAAADAASGTARLLINRVHPGDHRLADEGKPVPALTLDEIAAGEGAVSLVKIDVQGAEMRVLASATAILARDRPALFVEIAPAALAQFGASVASLVDWLAARGYATFLLTARGPERLERARLGRILARHGYTDVLFLPAAN